MSSEPSPLSVKTWSVAPSITPGLVRSSGSSTVTTTVPGMTVPAAPIDSSRIEIELPITSPAPLVPCWPMWVSPVPVASVPSKVTSMSQAIRSRISTRPLA